jgi:hypothetical protein
MTIPLVDKGSGLWLALCLTFFQAFSHISLGPVKGALFLTFIELGVKQPIWLRSHSGLVVRSGLKPGLNILPI